MNHTITAYTAPGIPKPRIISDAQRAIFEKVLIAVAIEYGLRPSDVLAKTRQHSVVEPRQVLMFLLRHHHDFLVKDIGWLCGGYDHSTVCFSRTTIKQRMSVEDELRARVFRILKELAA